MKPKHEVRGSEGKPTFTPGPWSYTGNPEAERMFGVSPVYEVGSSAESRGLALVPGSESNARLLAIAPEMYAKLDKLATWLERNAVLQEEAALRHDRFPAVAADELATARNYRATARDIRKLLKKADGA